MSAGGGQYELNLTPYIDLMSTLIVFLLMTVVWNQIAVLSTDGTVSSASDTAAEAKDKVHLAVTIMPGYTELAENQIIGAANPGLHPGLSKFRPSGPGTLGDACYPQFHWGLSTDQALRAWYLEQLIEVTP